MTKWQVRYVIDDGSTMFGLEPAREHYIEVELDTIGLDVFGEDEQLAYDRLKVAAHERIGGHVVVTGASEITDTD
ncbi:hypothetical protein [Actinomadura rubrisoli]|uniref:Uncharacterized protein n=1 Tax=Actinomadura rubrisoli TaxID=2530368 RepID=A0A4R5B2H6_9ACTN|nr:hypothetical protein [Actinomadura rubrisoli]TDD79921.1 hypothetical protein E1298_26895 [Actinomadura rubrisoli]